MKWLTQGLTTNECVARIQTQGCLVSSLGDSSLFQCHVHSELGAGSLQTQLFSKSKLFWSKRTREQNFRDLAFNNMLMWPLVKYLLPWFKHKILLGSCQSSLHELRSCGICSCYTICFSLSRKITITVWHFYPSFNLLLICLTSFLTAQTLTYSR